MVRLNAFQRQQNIPEDIENYSTNIEKLDVAAHYRIVICTCTTAGQLHTLGLAPGHFTHVIIDEVCWMIFSPLWPDSTQESKHRIGLDFFPSCIIRTAGPKKTPKYFNSLSFGLRITGSNWNRALVLKAYARVQFCSGPIPCL